ncbi:MAG: sodium-dependent bicarbonate transport family permease [Bacteroidales bacterium]|nr:sodium-dependent bicarbonate transport family permease [Bacteroidales bacterium]
MNVHLLLENLTNPALLFFVLGILSVYFKSDLEIPPNSSKFISLYLLFAIGFKGGQELAHEKFSFELLGIIGFSLASAILIPIYSFYLLKRRLNIYDSGAIAASYGSISAVTFVTAVSYLEAYQFKTNGHMVAVMALLEAPAIVVGLTLISLYDKQSVESLNFRKIILHSLSNGSVLLILGSLLIGYLATEQQAQGIKPFTTDIFKGFLAIFLLDMGITSGKKLQSLFTHGWFPIAFAILVPLFNGMLFAYSSQLVTHNISDRFILGVLAASASYIAVPAAMKISVPKADPGLFVPMALAITFPINITIGFPLYYLIAHMN